MVLPAPVIEKIADGKIEKFYQDAVLLEQAYVKKLNGPNVKKGKNKKDLAEQVVADIRKFKADNNLDRMVMVWCGSTEVFMTESPAHQTIEKFERALEENDPAIPSSMVYAYATIRMGIPYANAAPNLSADIPALMELAAHTKSPVAGGGFGFGFGFGDRWVFADLERKVAALQGDLLEAGDLELLAHRVGVRHHAVPGRLARPVADLDLGRRQPRLVGGHAHHGFVRRRGEIRAVEPIAANRDE